MSARWGDALPELERQAPDARIVNLETSVTRSEHYWRDKGIHYRMHPSNGPCLTAAKIDCCVLANNHVLDWVRACKWISSDGATIRAARDGVPHLPAVSLTPALRSLSASLLRILRPRH